MFPFINIAPILLTFATVFGVLVHDINVDKLARVTIAPLSVYASAATAGVLDGILNRNDHTHVERTSVSHKFSSGLPKVQPPRNDNRKYAQNKKQDSLGSDDRSLLWPSV